MLRSAGIGSNNIDAVWKYDHEGDHFGTAR
jgi:hypothetical protein